MEEKLEEICSSGSHTKPATTRSLLSRVHDARIRAQKAYQKLLLTLHRFHALTTESSKFLVIAISAIGFVLAIWIIFARHDHVDQGRLQPLSNAPEGYKFNGSPYLYENSKKILLYNARHDKVDWGIGQGNDPFNRQDCRVKNCFLTNDRNHLGPSAEAKFDAILFYLPGLVKDDLHSLPSVRTSSQRYVMVTDEPPTQRNLSILESFNGFFNWTMTYREDSDLPAPAGRILHVNKDLVHVDHKHMIGWNHLHGVQSLSSYGITTKRSKLVAWYVNDCNSIETHREDFASFLANYVQVDIYGPCGYLECPAGLNEDPVRCTKELSREYKFILAFEKSLCLDYISQYFFQVMSLPVVPVVMGSGNYDRLAPPKSYINVNDFASAKELANYLLYLDDNDDAFLSYFKWKDHYRIVERDPICGLCEMLNSNLPPKYYNDIFQWFSKSSECQKGIDMPWMISSLADEIQEKAEKKQKDEQKKERLRRQGAEVAALAIEEPNLLDKSWRPSKISMPGTRTAPEPFQSVNKIMNVLENSVGGSVTNIASKSARHKETARRLEEFKKASIYGRKSRYT